MSEKLKLAIRLSADTKAAIRAFADLKQKSLDTRQALKQTQAELKGLAARIRAAGGKDAQLAAQFEMARNKARELKTAWQGQQIALEQSRRSLSAMGISTANLSASVRRVSRAWVEAEAKRESYTIMPTLRASCLARSGAQQARPRWCQPAAIPCL